MQRIPYSHVRAAVGVLIFAIVWSGITGFMGFMALRQPKASSLIWLILFFPAMGLLFLIFAILGLIRSFRYGTSTLVLDSDPVRPGTKLRGHVEAREVPEGKVQATLRCVRRAGKDNKTLFREDESIERGALLLRQDGVSIPVHFDIPADATASQSSGPNIRWELAVSAGEMKCNFVIPVAR